ncbi:MAG TPA: DUF2147 domain-containing protein [Thermodesulfobacteriota bacterium]|nr:DUF2147 domain-containing protein [Thermodesulfobacteriota bacterium]
MKTLQYRLLIIAAFACAAFIASTVSHAGDINSDSIVGKWKDPDAPAIVQITNKGGYYEGVVVENPDNPAVVSTVVFKNLVYDGSDGVWKGTVFSLKKNKDFDAKISMENSSSFLLTVKAGLGSKKFEWTRAE